MPKLLFDSYCVLRSKGRHRPLSLAASLSLALPALVVGGCAGPSVPPDPLSLVNPRIRSSAPPPQPQAPAAASIGLQPLPSPDQVTAAVPLGRLDPFRDPRPPAPPPAPAAGAAAGGTSAAPGAAGAAGGAKPPAGTAAAARGRSTASPAPNRLPLDLTGVILTGGLPAALVQRGENSGTLLAGERGGAGHPFLPQGWRVDSININTGQMILRHGSTKYSYNLSTI